MKRISGKAPAVWKLKMIDNDPFIDVYKRQSMYRVLVVDDEEMITDSLAGMLEETPQYELDVYKAYSGRCV